MNSISPSCLRSLLLRTACANTLLSIALATPGHAQDPALPLPTREQAGLVWLRSIGQQCLMSNPSVQSSDLDYQSSQRSRESAWQQFLPTPSVSIDRADQPARTLLNQRTTTVRLQQPLWSGGRLSAALDQADATVLGSQQNLLSQAQFTLEQLIQTSARYRQARHRNISLLESVSTHQRLLEQVRRRVKEGFSPPSDLTVAESRFFSVVAEQTSADTDTRQQMLQLQRLLARPLSEEEIETLNTLPLQALDDNSWTTLGATAISERASQQPRVLKLGADSQQLEHRIRILKSNRLPQLSLRLDRIQGDVSGTDHVAVLSLNTNWGAGLSNERDIEAAQLRQQAVDLDRLAEQQEAERRLATLQQDLSLQRTRHAQLSAARDRTRDFLASSERLYLTGRKAWLEVLNAAREVAATEVAASDALLQIWSNVEMLNLLQDGPIRYLQSPLTQDEDHDASQ